MPYHNLGASSGAVVVMMACSRSARTRSASGIAPIFSSTSRSPSALAVRGLRRDAFFRSWACSFIAAISSSLNPSYFLVVIAGFLSAVLEQAEDVAIGVGEGGH